MTTNTLSQALRELAKSKERSLTAQLRDVFDDVEAALKAGVSRAKIIETLDEQGLKMSPEAFASAVYRIRKERKEQQGIARKENDVESVESNKEEKDDTSSEPSTTPYKSPSEKKKEREEKSSSYLRNSQKKRFD